MLLKTKLAGSFLLMAAVPTALLYLVVERETYANYEAQFEREALERMRLVDETFAHVLRTVEHDVRYLASSPMYDDIGDDLPKYFLPPNEKSVSAQRIERWLARFRENRPYVVAAYFGSRHGGFVGSVRRSVGSAYDPRNRPWYQAAVRAAPAMTTTAPYVSPGQQPMISVAQAVYADSLIVGVQSIDVTLDQLTELVEKARFGDSGHMILIDPNGLVLANSTQRDTVFRDIRTLDGDLFRKLAFGELGRFSAEQGEKTWEVLVMESPDTGWRYVSAIDNAELYTPVQALNTKILVIAVGMALVFSGVGVVLATQVVSPIDRVSEYLGRLASDKQESLRHIEVQSDDEIGDLTTKLNELLMFEQDRQQELLRAQKLEAVGQLASGIAHEINTPVQYVSNNIVFLKESTASLLPVIDYLGESKRSAAQLDDPIHSLDRLRDTLETTDFSFLREEMPAAIEQATEGLDQIAEIVGAMRDFSHPGDQVQSLDVWRALQNAATVAKSEWRYVADINIEVDWQLKTIECIPSLIHQSILNLVVNAAHAIASESEGEHGKRGTIEIRAKKADDLAEISVTDTGTGVPTEIIDRIFDPFFTTKAVGQGTGQGLAVVHNAIVKKHKGNVLVRNNPTRGATFTLQLPLSFQA